MDENSSLALLKATLEKRCPDLDEEFLRKLAELCGNIPLAMCIAASRVQDFKDPKTLLQHLENKPLETLQDSKSNQFVYKAIDMSYEKLTDEQKRSLVRLSVFKGNFSEEAVQAVIDKDDLDTNNFLTTILIRYS
jgi:predicted ATPase